MDVFDGRYYKLTKTLLSIIGIWPYQGYVMKRFTMTLGLFGIFGFLMPQVLYVLKYFDDLDKMFQALPTIIIAVLVVAKTGTLIVNCAQLKKLLNGVHEDWNNMKDTPEWEVLEEWMDRGRKLYVRYAFLLIVSGMWYYVPPLIAPTLDCVAPLNVSRRRSLLHAANYMLDHEKHFYTILLSQYLCNFTVAIAFIGGDSAYMLLLYHGCAKYAIVRFMVLIISMFTTYLLWDTGLGLVTHSTACFMIVIYKNDPSKIMPFISIVLAQSVRLFVNSWPAQKLMDQSLEVCNAVYDTTWYQISTRTRKLLLFMMMKSQTPCTITVANLYVINLDSFGMVMKTSMSYCTVMISVRDTTDSV